MSCEKKIHKLFQEHGLRFTFQRELILNILHSCTQPATVEDIYSQVQEQTKSIDISTVYRTLELFQEFGIVTGINTGSRQNVFELNEKYEPHIHLLCKSCGELTSVNIQNNLESLMNLLGDTGFQPDLLDIAIPGICKTCLNSKMVY